MPTDTTVTPPAARSAFVWAGVALAALSSLVRLISYPVVTSDYTYFLAKWFVALQSHPGLTAFQYPFSDYAPLYLYAIKILTFLPVPSLWSIKTLMVVCDIGVAYMAYRILREATEYSREKLFLAACVQFALPTVLLNSSLWGQSDALYALPVVASFYYIVRERPRAAALAFAVGFSIKLQAIFFLPILCGYLWRKGALGELAWIPAVYVLCALPAWAGGAPLLSTLAIYAHQSTEYPSLNVSSQSIFAFTDGLTLSAGMQSALFWAGLALASLCAAGTFFAAARAQSARGILLVTLLCVILVPYFLPRMHERYFYLADVFCVLVAYCYPRWWFISALVAGASLLAYMPYLSGQVALFAPLHVDLRIPSLMLLCAAGFLTAVFILQTRHAPRERGA